MLKTRYWIVTLALEFLISVIFWPRFKNIYDFLNSPIGNKSEIDDEDNVHNISVETSFHESSSEASLYTSDDCTQKKCAKKIRIQISAKVWRTIAPVEVLNKRTREGSHKTGARKYVTLQPGLWTNGFSNEIAKHEDIPCSWVFKRNKCYLSGEKFLIFEGKCNTCSASLVGLMKNKPEEDELANIDIQISSINPELHKKVSKKVKLTSKTVQQLSSQNKTATVISRNLLKDSSQMFAEPTARNVTANSIRCARYRQRVNDKISSCPITALSYLKASNLYMNCIQRISFDPFYIFYSTPEQKKMFNEFIKKNKTFKVSCDATGGIVHKIGKIHQLFKICIKFNLQF